MNDTKKLQQEVAHQARQMGIAAGDFMKEKGITQLAVEKKIGRGGGYVSPMVNGKTYIDTQVLNGIAELVGISLPALMVELSSRVTIR